MSQCWPCDCGLNIGQNPSEHQNCWQMDVHPPKMVSSSKSANLYLSFEMTGWQVFLYGSILFSWSSHAYGPSHSCTFRSTSCRSSIGWAQFSAPRSARTLLLQETATQIQATEKTLLWCLGHMFLGLINCSTSMQTRNLCPFLAVSQFPLHHPSAKYKDSSSKWGLVSPRVACTRCRKHSHASGCPIIQPLSEAFHFP